MTERRSPVRALLRASFLLVVAGVLSACSAEGPQLVAMPERPPEAVLIRNVSVLDVENGRTVPDRDVLLRGDRIAAIGVGGQLPAVEGAREIDGRGRTLLPGLVDAHGHVSLDSGPSWEFPSPDIEANLRSYLYSGVTTVLDPGDGTPDAFQRRDRIARGELLGPRIYTAGKLVTGVDSHPVALAKVAAPWWIRWYVVPQVADQIATPEDAQAVAAARAEQGADFLKLIADRIPHTSPRIDADLLASAVAEAKAHDLRSVVHIGDVRDALDSGRAGADAWVHGVYKERIPDEQLAELASFGIPMVATVHVFESYTSALDEGPRQTTRLERETVPAEVLESFNNPPEEFAAREVFEPYLVKVKAQAPHARENVVRLRDAGVTILAGSDTQSGVFPGPGLHRELLVLEEAGLTPAEVLRAATLLPARFLTENQDPDFGQIAVGKRADLVLVEGDPLTDLASVSEIREVILGGVPLERTPITEP